MQRQRNLSNIWNRNKPKHQIQSYHSQPRQAMQQEDEKCDSTLSTNNKNQSDTTYTNPSINLQSHSKPTSTLPINDNRSSPIQSYHSQSQPRQSMQLDEDEKHHTTPTSSTSVFSTNNPTFQTQANNPQILINIPPHLNNDDPQRCSSAPPPPATHSAQWDNQPHTPTSHHQKSKGFQAIISANDADYEWTQKRREWKNYIPSGKIRINAFNPLGDRFTSPGPKPVLTMTAHRKKQKEREANQSNITKRVAALRKAQKDDQTLSNINDKQ